MKKASILLVMFLSLGIMLQAQQQTSEKSPRMKPALLVIDVQNAYLPMVPEREKEVATYMINAFIELFRQQGFPVIRIYHQDKTGQPATGTEAFEFPATFLVKDTDAKVVKNYGDAFNKTDLDKILKEKGCNTLFLCGLSSVGCVLATYNGASNYDYNAFYLKDAVMSHDSEYTKNIQEIVGALQYDVVKLMLQNSEK